MANPLMVVASTNPVKLAAARAGFEAMFPEVVPELKGHAVPSGVADQPMTAEETYRGALNRVQAVRAAVPQADWWVGIEGGLEEVDGELAAFAWILVQSPTRFSRARTGSFFLAPKIADMVRGGMEMGHADDLVFGHQDSKRGLGATGILTHGIIDRAAFYRHAVILALIPFKNPEAYDA